MTLDKDGFIQAAFRKVQKIGKGLNSNGISNIAGFCKETDSQGVGKTERIALVRALLCLHFTRAITHWFSLLIFRHSIRFSSLRYTL